MIENEKALSTYTCHANWPRVILGRDLTSEQSHTLMYNATAYPFVEYDHIKKQLLSYSEFDSIKDNEEFVEACCSRAWSETVQIMDELNKREKSRGIKITLREQVRRG